MDNVLIMRTTLSQRVQIMPNDMLFEQFVLLYDQEDDPRREIHIREIIRRENAGKLTDADWCR
jgi:hypothetical protein